MWPLFAVELKIKLYKYDNQYDNLTPSEVHRPYTHQQTTKTYRLCIFVVPSCSCSFYGPLYSTVIIRYDLLRHVQNARHSETSVRLYHHHHHHHHYYYYYYYYYYSTTTTSDIIMAALPSRCGHYIFVLFLRSPFFSLA